MINVVLFPAASAGTFTVVLAPSTTMVAMDTGASSVPLLVMVTAILSCMYIDGETLLTIRSIPLVAVIFSVLVLVPIILATVRVTV
ncbi:MAG: hypothetical protein A4E27_00022 [Methanobacterium sp. PtaU1.Bin242]|nr:MAG: hypothetical protein A4E27_00022 [Methanobacterium sp. PtaU1.Bin242]